MCIIKTPKLNPTTQTSTKDKPLPVMRNPYLDGVDPLIRARQTGSRSLRIDRGSPTASPASARIERPTF